jgi:aminoglycoside phosphotransferase (APT) family kinase protein
VAPIGEGHSNVTYLVTRGDARFVLRRPPRGPIPPSAHDVCARRASWPPSSHAGAGAGRARRRRGPGIIGAPFFLMEAVEGDVVTSTVPAALDTPAERRRIGLELVDALADLHAVDWRAAGLEGFGKPTGYTERQLRRFLGLWEHNRTREIGEVERVAGWLRDNLPESGPATIVHGDFRLGTSCTRPGRPGAAGHDPGLGDEHDRRPARRRGLPLHDVERGVRPARRDVGPAHRHARRGFPTRAELVARYEERSGRTVRDIRWYTVLALWKSVVFMEGNFKRASSGLSDDPFLKTFGDGVVQLARRAEEVARGGA